MLDDLLKKVAVIGAAGKMGSGISLLLLQEIARCEADLTGFVGSGSHSLILIDSSPQSLFSLRLYLNAQITKYAEKNINALRGYYARDPLLVSNEEIIRAFVNGAMECISFETEVERAKDASLIFEAIIEDIDAKVQLYKQVQSVSRTKPFYFSNTSSIPISLLNERCQLDGRLIGYHFYNPPAVQKMLEIVVPEPIDPQFYNMALELAKRLHKSVVQAHDIAGFIGNGHFIREVLFACNQARQLAKEQGIPLYKAIYLINQVTQEYLLRPMGIFQLVDYVGIDVCQNIMRIMSQHLPDIKPDPLIDAMMVSGIKGGQYPDGSQKNGFLQYQKHALTGVYSLENREYMPLTAEIIALLGPMPKEHTSWKALQNDPHKKERLKQHFEALEQVDTLGAKLAKAYLSNSRAIAQGLVNSGVATKLEDVEAVLREGFFHIG